MNKKELFEFTEWAGEHYMRAHRVWIPRYASQTDKKAWKSTEDLYNFWKGVIKSKPKASLLGNIIRWFKRGRKKYICTDCGYTNFKEDNNQIRVGFCNKCEHPLWI